MTPLRQLPPISERVSRETVRHKVQQLLRDYAPFHYPYGGAGQLNFESKMGYGVGGLIFAGAEFRSGDRERLTKSFEYIGHALVLLYREDPEAWLALQKPYLVDPGDPSVAAGWREISESVTEKIRRAKKQRRKPPTLTPAEDRAHVQHQDHERAIHLLASYLDAVTLHVVWPKAMTSRKSHDVDRLHNQFHDYMAGCEADGMSRNRAIESAAERFGMVRSRAYTIADLRERPVSVELV